MKNNKFGLYIEMMKMCNNVNELKTVYDIINRQIPNDINKLSIDELTKINNFYIGCFNFLNGGN